MQILELFSLHVTTSVWVFSYIYFYGHTPWDAPLLPHKLLLDIICLCKHYMPLPGLHYLYIPYPYTTFFLMPVVFLLTSVSSRWWQGLCCPPLQPTLQNIWLWTHPCLSSIHPITDCCLVLFLHWQLLPQLRSIKQRFQSNATMLIKIEIQHTKHYWWWIFGGNNDRIIKLSSNCWSWQSRQQHVQPIAMYVHHFCVRVRKDKKRLDQWLMKWCGIVRPLGGRQIIFMLFR